MNILNLEKGVSLYEINNEFYFDLEDIAKKLRYARPKVAVNDFLKRNVDFQSRVVTHDDGRKLYDESTIYFFLLKGDCQVCRNWQLYVCGMMTGTEAWRHLL